MRKFLVATAGIAALCALSAAPAVAATQYLTVSPASGTLDVPVDLHVATGSYCPDDATRVIVRMTGPGLTEPFNLTGNTDITALDAKSIPGITIVPLTWTWRDAGGQVSPTPVDFDGDYRITMSCLKGLTLDSLGDSIADIHFNHAANSFKVTSPQAAPETRPAQPSAADPSSTTQNSPSAPQAPSRSQDPRDSESQRPSEGSGTAAPTASSESSSPPGAVQTAPGDWSPGASAPATAQERAAAEPSGDGSPSIPLTSLLVAAGLAVLVWAAYTYWRSRGRASSSQK